MIFTKIGKVAAWILIAYGAFMMAMRLVADNIDSPEQLPISSNPTVFNLGLAGLIIGLVLGVLCEISNHLKASADTKKDQG